MNTYHCNGFRPVRFDSPWGSVSDAARVFAERLAHRQYGKRGEVVTVRPDSWTEDRREHAFECFIGRPVKGNGTEGHNVWLYVKVRPYGKLP